MDEKEEKALLSVSPTRVFWKSLDGNWWGRMKLPDLRHCPRVIGYVLMEFLFQGPAELGSIRGPFDLQTIFFLC